MSLASAAITNRSGLTTVSSETAVLSRNISASSDTSYYSRKIANVVSTSSGPEVASVTRAYNQAVFENLLSATAASATQTALSAGLDTLNQTIGDVASTSLDSSSTGTSPAALIGAFSDALQTYLGAPTDSSAAAAVVTAAKLLASGLNNASATVQAARATADSDMSESVMTINSLLGQLQPLNTQIVAGLAKGDDVTDMQDQRDDILKQLSQQIGISTTGDADGGISIYTDSGVTLFQGGVARTVSLTPNNTFTPALAGNAVFVDGVAITGASAPMPITSGRLAGLATLRDSTAIVYQAQLDNIAGALINTFAESDQVGAGPNAPGLFTASGATTLPGAVSGLASEIAVNSSVDPSQGGDTTLLRDGGISGDPDYVYNSSGAASFTGRIAQLVSNLSASQSFSPSGEIAINARLGNYASASVSWLEAARSSASSQSDYQSTMLSTAATALSNATGVNIDDQMSQMLDLERSYSASAQLLSSINTMFNSLLTGLAR